MNKKLFICIAATALIFGVTVVSHGLEGDGSQAVYGVLTAKSADKITVSEMDLDTLEEVLQEYAINDETAFENVTGIDQLEVGDELEILIAQKNGGNFAVSIYKFDVSLEDPVTYEENSVIDMPEEAQ